MKAVNGIFDNTSTARREAYLNGAMTAFMNIEALEQALKFGPEYLNPLWRKPWGTYPDVKTMGKSPEGEK